MLVEVRMEKVTRDAVIQCLDHEYEDYVNQLGRFSPAEKEEFLQKQGFESMADFLAHIVGWWQECMRIIRVVQQEPDSKPANVNVDEFNVKIIEEFRGKGEDEIVGLFHDVRLEIMGLIDKLPESVIENDTINGYMYWCITNHVEEHPII
jgi:hypothetical protein